jgi:hypothetical protein
MQDPASELRRTYITRTWVNKGRKKVRRSVATPARHLIQLLRATLAHRLCDPSVRVSFTKGANLVESAMSSRRASRAAPG